MKLTMHFVGVYDLGERVHIDGEPSVTGTVAAVRFYSPEAEFLVSWFSNGDLKSDWFAHWRLTKAAG